MNGTAWRSCALALAVIAAAIAFSPQLDVLADAFFAWHMVQHMVLLFIVPALALMAQPFFAFRLVAGKEQTAKAVRLSRPLHALSQPAVALTFFIAVLWMTHYSALYEFSLENQWAHVMEHGLYLLAGTVFWLPVVAPAPLRPPSFPVRLLYLFVAMPQGALLALALNSARTPLYAHYAALHGVADALADQSNAAAVMWIAGGLILFTAFLVAFGVWAARENRGSAVSL